MISPSSVRYKPSRTQPNSSAYICAREGAEQELANGLLIFDELGDKEHGIHLDLISIDVHPEWISLHRCQTLILLLRGLLSKLLVCVSNTVWDV